ncbi:proteasome regulatory particle base subunit [Podila humilis]|nr:proteasome regulatory particle base subunit [Podila humilis]
MTSNTLTLFCLVDGEATSNAFSVKIPPSDTIDDLKKLIKAEKPVDFEHIDANNLTLSRVSIPITKNDSEVPILFNNIAQEKKEKLHPADDLSDIFDEKPPKKTIHIIVQRPPPAGYASDGSRPNSPPSGDLHADIKRIREKFFAAGSKHAVFLIDYVQGKGSLPITEDGLRGLSMVLRRGAVDSEKTQPSLFTDDLIPERFKSNILLGVLETMKAQDLPVFGVSGCGKTRTMVEMLFLQWGFYFNAAKSDLGSFDLRRLADFIQRERYGHVIRDMFPIFGHCELKNIPFSDTAIGGEAAGLAMGMMLLGTASEKELDDMLLYAHETQHGRIIRGLAVGPNSRYGGMYTIAMAYCDTGNNKAIRRLLHVAVSDVNDDVRRAALTALGFILFRSYKQVPRIVQLLSESYNPHVRYGACLALGISCAGTGSLDAIELLEPMTRIMWTLSAKERLLPLP